MEDLDQDNVNAYKSPLKIYKEEKMKQKALKSQKQDMNNKLLTNRRQPTVT